MPRFKEKSIPHKGPRHHLARGVCRSMHLSLVLMPQVSKNMHAGRYSEPQPLLLSDVDFTLRHIAKLKHLIATDLTSALYQIPIAQDSIKYCGVATPFKGVRVYVRSAMDMPGSERFSKSSCAVFLVKFYKTE